MLDLGFRGLGVSGFRVWGLGFKVYGLGVSTSQDTVVTCSDAPRCHAGPNTKLWGMRVGNPSSS